MAFEDYYLNNPVGVIDQNQWDDRTPEVLMNFLTGAVVYTPLIRWENRSQQTGALTSIYTDLLEGDVDTDEIAYDQMYIPEPLNVDSRFRKTSMARWGDKVQLHKSSQYFQMWRMSGGRDWRPLLRGVLGNNVRRKIEMVSRNAFLKGPKSYWTYGGNATSWNDLGSDDKFSLEQVNRWNLGLSQTGSPVVPGGLLTEKICIVPPGAIYDFQESLATASNNQAAMWRDATMYAGREALRYELGTFKNVRFVEAPNDRYGLNPAVLYNCGAITKQVTITSPINPGDGSPDPDVDADAVDGVWHVGQKDVTHYISTSAFDAADFAVNDIITIHTQRTNAYGVTNGVNPLSGKTINRRIVKIDRDDNVSGGTYYRLSFDRPIMSKYTADLGGSVYGYVTKGKHVGFCLAVGAGGGMHGNLNKPLEFYEPRPVDDFDSVWRYTWDMLGGIDVWEPSTFEPHFVAVTLPKPGGVIAP
jgi:hypothetical protein